jgi:hypothetical protein
MIMKLKEEARAHGGCEASEKGNRLMLFREDIIVSFEKHKQHI